MSRWLAETLLAAILALVGVITMIGASEFGRGWSASGPEPGAFPFYMGALIVGASLINAIRAIFPALRPAPWAEKPFLTREQARLMLGFTGPILALVVISLSLGLYVGMTLYLFGTLVFQNNYPKGKALLIACGTALFCYLLIEKVFQVAMLKGPLEAALGL